jgi:hypothetical protein
MIFHALSEIPVTFWSQSRGLSAASAGAPKSSEKARCDAEDCLPQPLDGLRRVGQQLLA